jgi:small Trp-rich protein
MWFIVAGVLLVVLKLADFGAVAAWSWWVVLAPFGAALIWWAYADASGFTKRREMDKLEEKKKERRRRAMDALGIDRESQKRGEAAQRVRKAAVDKVEGVRTEQRQKQEQVIRDSVFDSKTSTGFDDSRQQSPKKK